MNPLSINQLGLLSYWLRSNYMDALKPSFEQRDDVTVNRTLVEAENWIEKNIDSQTAWEIIDLIKTQKQDEVAFRQLVHLGLPIKEESLNAI